MKKLNLIFAILLLFLFLKTGHGQTVDEIIASHTKAIGGSENLMAIKSAKFSAKT